ncbi:hypothetical protein JHK86_009672 [Glycine max]|nr:hypothetical protein JHK86_009672 [Glycine max]
MTGLNELRTVTPSRNLLSNSFTFNVRNATCSFKLNKILADKIAFDPEITKTKRKNRKKKKQATTKPPDYIQLFLGHKQKKFSWTHALERISYCFSDYCYLRGHLNNNNIWQHFFGLSLTGENSSIRAESPIFSIVESPVFLSNVTF